MSAVNNNNRRETRSLDGDTGTQITKYLDSVVATTILHTVTAGKTFYLSHAWYSIWNGSGSATTSPKMLIRDGADATTYYIAHGKMNTATAKDKDRPYLPPIKVPAGYDIVAVGVASIGVSCGITGWEE